MAANWKISSGNIGRSKKATEANLGAAKELDDDLRIALGPHDDAAVLRAVAALRDEKPIPREALRTAEFKQLMAQKNEVPGELPNPDDRTSESWFWARRVVPDGGPPVVDSRWSLVGSANFTHNAHARSIELGVLIEDPAFATALVQQWRGLVEASLSRLRPSGDRVAHARGQSFANSWRGR